MSALSLLLCGYIFMIDALAHNVESSKCPSITLSDHSTSDPVVTNGSNYTFYQEFVTESNAHDLNISWSRTPNELDPSSGSFEYVNNNTVKASLSLWNITLTDNGEYTVKASNNCTSKKAVFDLYVYICEQDTPPQPLTQYTVTVIAEPEVPTILNLTVEFRGTLSCAFYVTDWRFDGSQLCLEGSNTSKFSCDRTMMNSTDCSFLANLWIMGPTHVDSGLYTVRTIGGQPSSTSTVDLRILRQPRVNSCTPGALQVAANKHAEFVCQISNYSDYAKVVVVENNRVVNKSSKQLSFGCQVDVTDSSSATCTVNILASRQSGKLQYKLCVGYNSTVLHKTTLRDQCSDDITVTVNVDNDKLKVGLSVGGTCAVILLVVLVASILAIRVYMRRRAVVTETDGPTKPLLHPVNGANINSTRKKCNGRDTMYVTADVVFTDYGTNTEPKVTNEAVPHTPMWKNVRSGPLERGELVHIAKAIRRWSVLARYLGLTEPDIIAIEENHVHNYEEQKYQMLLKWYQQQKPPPTRQSLVRIIEEKMKDSRLAQDIVNIVGTTTTECTHDNN